MPEFNSGAMENVGCVTINEAKLHRGEHMTLGKRMRTSITVLHELAHMWFGNLVTMKWWDDLWLNESFATYMSYYAMSKAPELKYFKNQWNFFLSSKFRGIDSDQLSSTHPIFSHIKSSDEAESVFDGISYGKGASFLKQMNYLLGEDTLKVALTNYFD